MMFSRASKFIPVWMVLIAFCCTSAAQAQNQDSHPKIEPKVMADLRQHDRATFFVVLRAQADVSHAAPMRDWRARGRAVASSLKEMADRTQQTVLERLASAGAQATPFWIVNTIMVTTRDRQLIQSLAAMPAVAAIKAEQVWRIPEPAPGADEPTIDGVEWGVARVRAPEVWNQFGARGQGIVIANIDTGVQFNHPALARQYQGWQTDGTFDHNYSWHDPSGVCGDPSLAPCDNQGHGTHTMGIAVGDDGAANQIGVAPAARWIAAKGCETDLCSLSALLSAGQWILTPTDLNGQNPRPDLRPHIVNNSWGAPGEDSFYRATVQAWRSAGIFPVFSSGNNGSSCGSASVPGAYPESFSVGAVDIMDNVAGFSGRGGGSAFGSVSKPNLSAPGVNVRSSFPGDAYVTSSGTSMATPHVAGVVALLWSAIPQLVGDVVATEEILQSTAQFRPSTQCGSSGPPNNVYGWGIVDALAALEDLSSAELVASPATIPGGGMVTVEWSGLAAPTATDWIGLYRPGSANTAYLEWIYVSCSHSPGGSRAAGSCPFHFPASAGPGNYELRLLANDGFTAIAASNPITVTGGTGQPASLAASPSSVPSGGTLTAQWSGITAPSPTDWIGLYQPGSANAAFIEWIYVSCSKSAGSPTAAGSCLFNTPVSLPSGAYELRLLANDGFNSLAVSNSFTAFLGQALAR